MYSEINRQYHYVDCELYGENQTNGNFRAITPVPTSCSRTDLQNVGCGDCCKIQQIYSTGDPYQPISDEIIASELRKHYLLPGQQDVPLSEKTFPTVYKTDVASQTPPELLKNIYLADSDKKPERHESLELWRPGRAKRVPKARQTSLWKKAYKSVNPKNLPKTAAKKIPTETINLNRHPSNAGDGNGAQQFPEERHQLKASPSSIGEASRGEHLRQLQEYIGQYICKLQKRSNAREAQSESSSSIRTVRANSDSLMAVMSNPLHQMSSNCKLKVTRGVTDAMINADKPPSQGPISQMIHLRDKQYEKICEKLNELQNIIRLLDNMSGLSS